MKTTNPKTKPFSKFYCSIFGHNYTVSKTITYHVKEYTCVNCKHELTNNGKGNFIELSPKYREINAILSRVHNKKITRSERNVVSERVYKMTS